MWAHWRPISAIECQAWTLGSCFGRVGVVTSAECIDGREWVVERHLVRLPRGVRAPRSAGQCLWTATFLTTDDFFQLTPVTIERLRATAPLQQVEASL
jgi:hypothetical protein